MCNEVQAANLSFKENEKKKRESGSLSIKFRYSLFNKICMVTYNCAFPKSELNKFGALCKARRCLKLYFWILKLF